jgi:hypothetical protein
MYSVRMGWGKSKQKSQHPVKLHILLLLFENQEESTNSLST